MDRLILPKISPIQASYLQKKKKKKRQVILSALCPLTLQFHLALAQFTDVH